MSQEDKEEQMKLVALLSFLDREMNECGATYINIVIDSKRGLSSISSNLGDSLDSFDTKDEFVNYFMKRLVALFSKLEESCTELEEKESSCNGDEEECKHCKVPTLLRQIVPYRLIKLAVIYIQSKLEEMDNLDAEDEAKFNKFLNGEIDSLTDDDINRYIDKMNIKNKSGD